MLICPHDNDCYLLETSDVTPDSNLEIVQRHYPALEKIMAWAAHYLSAPHQDLGRKGPVCPFVKASIAKNLFWFTVFEEDDPSIDQICNVVLKYRNWFMEMTPSSSQDEPFKTILILFPNVPVRKAAVQIEKSQKKLKLLFVQEGLMIGQFHPFCEEPGIRNECFRPLKSEIPLLALRNMVSTDYPFLKDEEAFREAYDRFFPSN